MITVDDLKSANVPLFAELSADDLNGMTLDIQEKSFAPWEILFNQQDTSNDVYILLEGKLLALYWTEAGREIIFTRFSEGDLFGEMAALDGGERSLAIVARSDVRVLVMPQATFLELFNKVPAIRTFVVNSLVARVRHLTAKNLELTTFSVGQRVASFLISMALERDVLEKGGVINDAPTHAEIAASIGANREMVSRAVTQLVKKKAIRSARQRIELVDPDILSDVL
ncbi:cAMP-binding domain of CRP or a regulatory subunit of cAMP-dependent protein kinases [Thalassococcus halodurans]|uniref:cAMP-binding domain of CRP or a regulatory subunit of cAMP-dependent protein kinases n=1 Tax=Thalassococcus halodurans TaxID=373675 RepID=A0A1H6A5Q0_9RHOB|nr:MULTISPECIES: Crp/Fnr family transcriptional regulator [Thalassococcus]MBO6867573.1 Crp/Fnr family transcriptional regulator [Thalassococcus sp.]SEG43504.1 cAMP-binding domain of CRP or a regulatory subunit of cAMP-dependent protein kinases [Thalassococcus halodurans]